MTSWSRGKLTPVGAARITPAGVIAGREADTLGISGSARTLTGEGSSNWLAQLGLASKEVVEGLIGSGLEAGGSRRDASESENSDELHFE